ncbi:MAG: cbb3-type cytochrome c oxidase subunit 3 [Cocleimonas sp.]|nr:cbb3-type cytochrome c oxidase subunit 3 [Cocleimonas sp.]
MYDIWMWLTDLGNSKITALLIFFPLFMGMLFYVYTNKKRSKRLESYKYIPFDDERDERRFPIDKVKNNG